jgi:hypothetical protein
MRPPRDVTDAIGANLVADMHVSVRDWRAAYKKWIKTRAARNSGHEGEPDAPQT